MLMRGAIRLLELILEVYARVACPLQLIFGTTIQTTMITLSQTLTSAGQLATLRSGLSGGQVAIVSSQGHAAVVASTYADPYVSSYLGDVWMLPGGGCSCN